MEEQNWDIRPKVWGREQVRATDRWDPTLRSALTELAKRETARTGVKISASTIMANLITRKDLFAYEKRSELRKLVTQLNKENKHGRSHTDH